MLDSQLQLSSMHMLAVQLQGNNALPHLGSDLFVNTAAAAAAAAEQMPMEFEQPSTLWPWMPGAAAALSGQGPSSDATAGSQWMLGMCSNELAQAISANQTPTQVQSNSFPYPYMYCESRGGPQSMLLQCPGNFTFASCATCQPFCSGATRGICDNGTHDTRLVSVCCRTSEVGSRWKMDPGAVIHVRMWNTCTPHSASLLD